MMQRLSHAQAAIQLTSFLKLHQPRDLLSSKANNCQTRLAVHDMTRNHSSWGLRRQRKTTISECGNKWNDRQDYAAGTGPIPRSPLSR
ncbi:hypothetical protein HZ326_20687 [Fusarium oxysporum f. sp. albedinis]|nr:hypothetical protein HZ326_20687 [Fusarium oxysporum f. sp. albedinis]